LVLVYSSVPYSTLEAKCCVKPDLSRCNDIANTKVGMKEERTVNVKGKETVAKDLSAPNAVKVDLINRIRLPE
jgi:hypothetical protein